MMEILDQVQSTGHERVCLGKVLACSSQVPVDMQCEAVGLPAHRGRVGLEQEATQELNKRLLICKFIELTDQSCTQLVFLTASSISCRKHNRNIEKRNCFLLLLLILMIVGYCSKIIKPSLSFSLSSFLLFLLEDLLWEGWDEPPEPPPEAPEEEAARTLLPHKAQESSCSRTGETPSSTRKLTCSRKYNTATQRERIRLVPQVTSSSWVSIPRDSKNCKWKLLWIKTSAKCINVNVGHIVHLQSSFMQNFCQLIVLWVAISAHALRCSICVKGKRSCKSELKEE